MKTIFFDLFLFTTGYKVGPQFFRGLKRDALPQVALTVVLCVTCLLTAFRLREASRIRRRDGRGLLAGAFSESTVIGTAGEAIQRLAIPDAEKAALINNIPVAYAVTYLIGTASLVWFLPTIGPKLMGIKLREEGARMQAAIAGAAELELGVFSAARAFDVRAYRVTNPDLREQDRGATRGAAAGRAGLHRAGPPRRRDHRGRARHRHSPGRRRGDHGPAGSACAARRRVSAPKCDDKALLDIPIETLDVVVTNRSLVGQIAGGPGTARKRARRVSPAASCGPDRRFRWMPGRSSTGATCCASSAPSPRSSVRRRNWDMPIAPPRRRTWCSSERAS